MNGRARIVRDNRERIKSRFHAAAEGASADEAAAVAEDAKQHIPVRTGETRDSVTASPVGPARWRVSVGGAGLFLEFGTVKMAAQPFLLPALQRAKQRFRQRIVDGFRAVRR